MAARKSSADLDDTSADDLDDGEGFDEADLDDGLDETSLDEAFAEESDDDLDDDLGEPATDLDEEDPTELTAAPVDPEATDEDLVAPPEASFDDEDDDDQEIEGLRDGEFVCRSCFMAKRDTQLADPEQLLCRDCA